MLSASINFVTMRQWHPDVLVANKEETERIGILPCNADAAAT